MSYVHAAAFSFCAFLFYTLRIDYSIKTSKKVLIETMIAKVLSWAKAGRHCNWCTLCGPMSAERYS